MSKDKLERFIDNHREELDTEIPSLHIWKEIDSQINPKQKSGYSPKGMTRVAAGIALLVIGSFFTFHWVSSANSASTTQSISVADMSSELEEAGMFYSDRINRSKARLISLGHRDANVYRDLVQMEQQFEELQKEWNENPVKSNDHLTNAMINNYRNRADLLERVINQVERRRGRTNSFARPAVNYE